jgi:hypothetical protein
MNSELGQDKVEKLIQESPVLEWFKVKMDYGITI